MGTIYLTRRVEWASGHAYWFDDASEEENRRLFGPFACPEPHGHNYALEATVGGGIDPVTGMVVNIKEIDRVLKGRVAERLDLRLLNRFSWFADARRPPSMENLARFAWEEIEGPLQALGVTLARLRLEEHPTLTLTARRADDGGPVMQLTRTYEIAASHRLYSERLSDDQNEALFGKCANPHGHGHNYLIEVSVTGEVDPVTGMLVDLAALDRMAEEEIVAPFDHRYLNREVAEFRDGDLVPTTENLTVVLWRRLEGKIPPPAKLSRLVVRETARNFFEYYGEEPRA